ncbi:MAG: hypothetical protein JJE04_24515 [Acidobacteriia bacterium]|nr:hypothetical protein [Terriglobia bacterium]
MKDRLQRRIAGAVVAVVLLFALAQTATVCQAGTFLHYLEASRNAQGISGDITLWERLVYSFILSTR